MRALQLVTFLLSPVLKPQGMSRVALLLHSCPGVVDTAFIGRHEFLPCATL